MAREAMKPSENSKELGRKASTGTLPVIAS
jgi:hypothetical protein